MKSIDEELLLELLDNARADLDALLVDTTLPSAMGPTTRAFVARVGSLGLRLQREPALRTRPEVTRFLQETGAHLYRAMGHLERHAYEMKDWYCGEWAYDEWGRAVHERSAIEYLLELYGDSPSGVALPMLDEKMAEIDDLLQQKVDFGVYVPFDRVRPGTPASHWWWWYPEVPPAGGAR